MKREKYFSYLRSNELTVCVGGESPCYFPLTYTLEEAFEDVCDRLGFDFVKIICCYPAHNISALGNGKFSYRLTTTRCARSIAQNRIYAEFYSGVDDSWRW